MILKGNAFTTCKGRWSTCRPSARASHRLASPAGECAGASVGGGQAGRRGTEQRESRGSGKAGTFLVTRDTQIN